MSSISKPNTFSASTTISSSEVNDNFDTIYNDYNGNISSANLADDAVTTAKITDGSVTTAKIADNSVNDDKIGITWQSWSPSWTGVTVGNGTEVARYMKMGSTVWVRYQLTLGSTSSVSSSILLAAPVTAYTNALNLPIGTLYMYDTSSTEAQFGSVVLTSVGNFNFFRHVTESGTNPVQVVSSSNVSTNQPWTWATGDIFAFTAVYEAA